MAFSRRITEDFRTLPTTPNPGVGTRNASSITRLIIHQTGGWPHNSVEDISNLRQVPLNRTYHFLVETGINQHATGFDTRVGRERGRVSYIHDWSLQVGHAGTNNNANSIGISVAGNYGTTGTTPPPTNLDNNSGFRPQVERHLSQIIADCLISFPSIARTNRVRTNHPNPFQPVTASGIMRHADVDSNNPQCPGTNLGVSRIINNGILMANTLDAAESLRSRGGINGITSVALVTQWSRNATLLRAPIGVTMPSSVGDFIISVNNNRMRLRQTPHGRITTASGAITHLTRTNPTLIAPGDSHTFWQNNHTTVPNLSQLLISVANLLD